jgi:NAD(P)-dependent dehydrogenase (short-subunit alcohol dehydrogenase family)
MGWMSSRRKTVLITGGGGGIGAATARIFAEAGMQTLVVDISEPAGLALEQEIKQSGGECRFFAADIREESSVEAYVSWAIAQTGAIDIFINNAGVEGSVVPISEYPTAEFDKVVAVNLRGTFLGLKHVLKHMQAANGGSIVNVSSVAGLRGSVGLCAYVASKHALLGLTKTAAIESARFGIRVNAVCPGPIDTRMIHAIAAMSNPDDSAGVRDVIARNPSGRLGTPDEIANAIFYLASDACPYLNGEAVVIDGGRTAI